MAYPQVENTVVEEFNSKSNTHDITIPAGWSINSGDLLLEVYTSYENVYDFTISGWTRLYNITDSFNLGFGCFYKSADGTEAGTTVTIDHGGSKFEGGVSILYHITGWDSIEGSSSYATDVDSTTIDFPSLSPSWGADDNLWILHGGLISHNTTVSSLPTNYTNLLEGNVAGGDSEPHTAMSARRENNVATEDPDTLTWNDSDETAGAVIVIQGTEDNPLSGNITLDANPEESVEVGIWELSTLSFNITDLGTPEEIVSTDANGDWSGTHDPTKTYFIAVLHNKLQESGTATGGSANTLEDTGKSMTVDVHAGRMIEITGGTGSGQMRKIASNTSTAFTVDVDWDTTPDNTSDYEVYDMYGAKTKILPVTG